MKPWVHRSLRAFLPVASATAAFAFLLHCRRPTPEEIVYTGRGQRPVAAPTAPTPPPVDPGPGGAFSKVALLTAIADCTTGRLRDFEGLARSLRDAARAYEQDRSETKAKATKDAWVLAMASWEEAELFRFGPAASPPMLGAKGLRDAIYAWPQWNRCKADEQIVAKTYLTPGFGSSLVNGRGLATVEYLAFYSGTDNACSQFSSINSQGSWGALGADELGRRKAAYAAAVADDVLANATGLLSAWAPSSGNFYGQLVTAGAGSATYATQQDAFNAITDGLFYIDNEVKDLKLGRPLGFIDCFSPTCPDAVESLYARVSTAHLRANLVGTRRLLQGCGDNFGGLGFDDWLREVGASDLANRMLGALVGAQAAVDALDPPFEQALLSDRSKVEHVHTVLHALTDPLKTEFITVLNLELPKSSEGDND